MADEAASRALLLNSGTSEAVTVNQRALIDKILARYAAEFTVFRELIQNSDDAEAEACELRFHSQQQQASSSSILTEQDGVHVPNLKSTLRSWVFRNNGKPFNDDDWNRLRRIAEGNPDPDRIGAFGVGFYSLFSISEEPIVSSASQLMGFFWKEDSLFTRRAASPKVDNSPSGKPWTTFHMPLREPAPFSDSFLDLSRFLATSLTFTANVKQISLYFDDQPLCRLKKTLERPLPLLIPSHLNTYTPRKMLRIQSMDTTAMRLEVEAMKLVLDLAEKPKPALVNLASAFTKQSGGGFASMLQNAFGRSKKEEPKTPLVETPPTPATPLDATSKAARSLTTTSATVHVRIASATASVSIDRSFEREIERSTKKPPPKLTRLQVIAQNKQEAEASKSDGVKDAGGESSGNTAEIFKGIMPSLDAQGHVFIGFKTSQTTSFAGHLAARFIPTVERESIDFIDKYCAQWNNELLAAGGFATRAVYEAELAQIGKEWIDKLGQGRPREGDETAKALLERALHIMRFFTFRTSTPSPRVYGSLESAFFNCARQAIITLVSSRGVKHSALVRFPNATLAEFIKDLPVIPPSHVEFAGDFVSQVKSRGLVREISMEDVFSELAGRALTVVEMTACLRWWINVAGHAGYDASLMRQLVSNALIDIPSEGEGSDPTIQQLAVVKTFLNPQRIPTDVPLPNSCLHYEVSRSFAAPDLWRVFGWSELTVSQWLTHVTSLSRAKDCPIETNIQLSPPFTEKVLGIIARAWGSLPAQQQEEITATLKDVSCVPTRKGMMKPSEAYFANVSLFDDLPIVALPTQTTIKGNLEKVLAALGVRRHVELQMIFDRLVAAGDWDMTQLVTYLAANKESLTSLEKERLVKTAMFPKAGEVGPLGKEGKPKVIRYRASQLYEPTDMLKALKLPLLDWPGKVWRSNSDEAKFAFELGLRRHPPIEDLLHLASSSNEDVDVRGKALTYLLDKLPTVYKATYTPKLASTFAFIPCRMADGQIALKKPTEAFTNPEAKILGFPTISSDLSAMDVAKLGLRSNPSSAQIVTKLVNEPTKDVVVARRIFEYLAGVTELTVSDYKLLSTALFIPVSRSNAKEAMPQQTDQDQIQVTLSRPTECFFGDKSAGNQLKDVLNQVFTFIDFGERAAVFLRNCGVSNEPSIEEVATQLVRDPQRFFRIAGVESYLGILRQIATNWQRIPYGLRSEMKRSSFALASKRISVTGASSSHMGENSKSLLDEDDEEGEEETDEQGVLVHDLKKPGEIVIVDDATSHMLFASVVFAAPHEDLIESMMADLGAKRLSSLVEERYTAAGQVQFNTPRCAEVQATVLERTPLFIFEKRQTGKSEIRHDAEWLKSRLDVAQVDGRGLRLTRQLRYGSLSVSNEQRCSAMAATGQSGKLILYIAGNMETDWFEVAMALSKHLLTRQRLQEVLLYMTLLSTSLRNLKRRGFHVDKILTQRKAEREAAERIMREERAKAELEAAQRPSESQIKQWRDDMLAVFPDADPTYVERILREAKTDHVVRATNVMLEQPYPKVPPKKPFGADVMGSSNDDASSKEVAVAGRQDLQGHDSSSSGGNSARNPSFGASGGFFNTWRNKFRGNDEASLPSVPGGWQPGQTKHPFPEALAAAASNANKGRVAESIAGSVTAGNTTSQATARNPNDGVTPSANIKRKVLSAIDASRGRGPSSIASDTIASQGHQTKVKEAQSTYCDTTGVAMNLRLAGQIRGMNVYVSPELDPSSTLTNNGEAMQTFIDSIVKPIVNVFNVDLNSVNVFVDVSGPSIAFNRGGQLFLNFRYHLVWFDEEVRSGRLTNALISTYHSLAHELAHNLVAQHDSEHEFWFSSICEQYFVPFAALVAQAEASTPQQQQARTKSRQLAPAST